MNKSGHTAALLEQSMHLTTTGCEDKSPGFDGKALNEKE